MPFVETSHRISSHTYTTSGPIAIRTIVCTSREPNSRYTCVRRADGGCSFHMRGREMAGLVGLSRLAFAELKSIAISDSMTRRGPYDMRRRRRQPLDDADRGQRPRARSGLGPAATHVARRRLTWHRDAYRPFAQPHTAAHAMAFHYFNKGSPAIGRLTEPFISLANTLGDHASSPFADERISGEKRLTIGIGGDVPVYTPLLIAELVMVAFVLKRLYGRWPLSTGMLSLPPIRTGAAFAAFAWVDKTRRECAFYMEQLGNGADYEPLRGLVTDGPYAELRHPFYRALCLVLPAISIIFNSAWMCAPSRTIGASGYSPCARVVSCLHGRLLLSPIVPIYLHFMVVPNEEALLSETYGSSYAHYHSTVGCWF